ncbi:MAG: hypothetical protein EBT92_14355 [Planctomycetes bacterium]|nr:hypothetical protein [Planctomycetota bacterium]
MNDKLDPQNEAHELAHMTAEEQIQEQKFMDEAREIREADMARGWPGDGSGMDDFADYNQNEAMDYSNE